MANPRKVIVHDGIGFRAETFWIDASTIVWSATAENGSVGVNLAVGLVAGTKDTVELVAAGQSVLGRLDNVAADGACTVQVEGQCYLPQGTGGSVVRGGKIVGALSTAARGYIGPPTAPGGTYAQAEAVSQAAARHRVEDITDTANISVYLDA